MRPAPDETRTPTSRECGVSRDEHRNADTEQAADIDGLRQEIDRLDAEILAAVKRRAEVSRAIGKARMASGGTRLVHSREMKVIERYSELGPEGKDLAMLLLGWAAAGSVTDLGRLPPVHLSVAAPPVNLTMVEA